MCAYRRMDGPDHFQSPVDTTSNDTQCVPNVHTCWDLPLRGVTCDQMEILHMKNAGVNPRLNELLANAFGGASSSKYNGD